MKVGNFDQDTVALRQRLKSHNRFGSRDLNEWIFKLLDVSAGLSILDLGCGTGNQSLPLAQAVGPLGKIIAVDISSEALADLQRQCMERGLRDRIAPICIGFDNLDGNLKPATMDRVVASYSLYYAENALNLFRVVKCALKKGGIFFGCGPALDNNSDFISFYYGNVKHGPLPPPSKVGEFMEFTAPNLLRELFGGVEIYRFENPMRFDSAEALIAYWSSHNLYERQLENAFREAVEQHFRLHNEFQITKKAVGLRAIL